MTDPEASLLARRFLGAAILYGVLGIALGLAMAIAHDHSQRSTHAHINVIGVISFFLFALFYRQWGAQVSRLVARVHFWLAQAAMLGMTIGLWLFYDGQTQFEAVAAISATTYGASFLVFAIAAWPVVTGKS